MPTVNDLKQSKFLTKHEVNPPVLVTIGGYEQFNVAVQGAEPEMKWALKFHELEKPMVLNSTNGQLIAKMTGSEDFDGWIGKQIVLYDDPTINFGGKVTGGIRVRAPKIKAGAAPAAKPVVAPVSAEPEDSSVPF